MRLASNTKIKRAFQTLIGLKDFIIHSIFQTQKAHQFRGPSEDFVKNLVFINLSSPFPCYHGDSLRDIRF